MWYFLTYVIVVQLAQDILIIMCDKSQYSFHYLAILTEASQKPRK